MSQYSEKSYENISRRKNEISSKRTFNEEKKSIAKYLAKQNQIVDTNYSNSCERQLSREISNKDLNGQAGALIISNTRYQPESNITLQT